MFQLAYICYAWVVSYNKPVLSPLDSFLLTEFFIYSFYVDWVSRNPMGKKTRTFVVLIDA